RKDQYSHPYHRYVLVGLRDALYRLESGTEEERIAAANQKAIDLMEDHSPSRECSWSIPQQLRSSYWLNEGCFWKAPTPKPVKLSRPRTAAADPTDVLEEVETDATPANGKAKAEGKEKPKDKEKKTTDGPYRLRVDEVRDKLPQRIGRIRLNLRTGHVEANGEELAGDRLSHLYLRLSSRAETWGREVTTDAASYHANRDAYDPVQEWLEGNTAEPLPMEQWEALEEHLLGITDPLGGTILRRFLIGAVARVLEPGCWWRCAPVLVGGQNKGKTELIRALAGDWFLSGLGKLDRDATQRLRRAWLVEMGELDGITRRSDQEHLKAFLTERVDTYRSPYARAEDSHPRRCVFIGTANGSPLRDSTGSTRFAVIATGDSPLPVAWVKEHRGAIWARALEQYRAGVSWTHTEEEQALIAERNGNHTVYDPWREVVSAFLDEQLKKQGGLGLPVQMPDLYRALYLPIERQTNQTAERVGRILQGLGWEKAQRRHNGSSVRGWWPVTACHGRHGPVTAPPVTPEALQDKGSGEVSRPSRPISQELETRQEQGEQGPLHLRQEQNAPENPLDGHFGRDGRDTPADPFQRKGSAVTPPAVTGPLQAVTGRDAGALVEHQAGGEWFGGYRLTSVDPAAGSAVIENQYGTVLVPLVSVRLQADQEAA
ncbi:MAG: VapE domain-containing protein, partial [Cyanobacteriota bacterium]|nr:VapE domain-containing protein [Cyanobacteriota bacterium]